MTGPTSLQNAPKPLLGITMPLEELRLLASMADWASHAGCLVSMTDTQKTACYDALAFIRREIAAVENPVPPTVED